jgi:tRNA(fMet)-specific endonuclease VapC
MPRYMLDTNMCIYLMRNQPEEVARRFSRCYVGDVVMSSITYAELEYGVAASKNPEKERIHLASLVEDILVIPFDAAAGVWPMVRCVWQRATAPGKMPSIN